MKKNFIIWQLKRWIVPLAIFLGVLVFVGFIAAITSDFYNPYMSQPLFTLIILFSMFVSLIFPIMAFSYKFGLQRCDFYYQLPFKEKELKRTVLLFGLICILVVVVVGYGITASIFAIKYISSPATQVVDLYGTEEVLDKISLDLSSILYALPYLILMCASTYLIGAAVTYNNIGVFESIICLVLLHVALTTVVMGPVSVVARLTNNIDNMPTGITFGFYTMMLSGGPFDTLLLSGKFDVDYTFYLNSSIYLGIGLLGGAWVFFEKDRSADLDNTKGEPKLFPIIVLHVAFFFALLTIGTLFSSTWFIALSLIMWLFLSVVYFFLNVLYKHGFKLEKKQWIPMIPIIFIGLLSCFICLIAGA